MLELLTPGQAGLQRLKECSEEASAQYLPAVRTMYRVDEQRTDRPEAFGTSFLMEVDGGKFIITAAHVFDETNKSSVYVAGESSLVKLSGEFHVTAAPSGDRDADKYDFAFQELDADAVKKLGSVFYIDASQVSLNRGTMDGRMFMALGYPASRNRISSPEVAKAHILAKAWIYCGTVYTDGVAATKIGAGDETHLLLKHSHKTSKTFTGQLTNSVKPHGASGGVLVDLGLPHPSTLASDSKCTARLAGVLIEKHNACNAIVATKIELVLQAIRGSRVSALRDK
jgi:hypothetical protein